MTTVQTVTTVAPTDSPAHNLTYAGLILVMLIGAIGAALKPAQDERMARTASDAPLVSGNRDANTHASRESDEVGVSILMRGPAFY